MYFIWQFVCKYWNRKVVKRSLCHVGSAMAQANHGSMREISDVLPSDINKEVVSQTLSCFLSFTMAWWVFFQAFRYHLSSNLTLRNLTPYLLLMKKQWRNQIKNIVWKVKWRNDKKKIETLKEIMMNLVKVGSIGKVKTVETSCGVFARSDITINLWFAVTVVTSGFMDYALELLGILGK